MKKEKGVVVNIHLSNKFMWFLVGVFTFTLLSAGVYAVWSAPGQYHASEEVRVNISGEFYSLQEAIDLGLWGGAGGSIDLSNVKGTVVGGGFEIREPDYPGDSCSSWGSASCSSNKVGCPADSSKRLSGQGMDKSSDDLDQMFICIKD